MPHKPNGLSHAAGLQFSAGPAALIPLYLPVRLVGNEGLILTTPIVGKKKCWEYSTLGGLRCFI